ncbi:MAG: heat-inducible transcriptional repressor HrcA [Candidatus Neomarinimicrobiota bacterium]
MVEFLTERKKQVLSATVEDFIRTATPVASGRIANTFSEPLSSATIRIAMAELERGGYLTHPHTSAGKIPTDKGYRAYVNKLMVVAELNDMIQMEIRRELEEISGNVAHYMQVVAHIISQLSNGVGISITPVSLKAVLEGIRLVPISPERVLFVLEFDSGSPKTVLVELDQQLDGRLLTTVEEILRERLCGVSLEEIQSTIVPRLQGTLAEELGIITVIMAHSTELFTLPQQSDIYTFGLRQLLLSPEFGDPENIAVLAGLLEDEHRLRDLAWVETDDEETHVTIGTEHDDKALETFTTIGRRFHLGDNTGTLAVLAPKRVDYAHTVAVLDFLGRTITEFF